MSLIATTYPFTGASGLFLTGYKPSFFRPYESVQDVAVRAAAIITAPVILTAYSCASAILAIYKLLTAIANTFTDPSLALENIKECRHFAAFSIKSLAVASISLFANLLDFIVSAFVKAYEPLDLNVSGYEPDPLDPDHVPEDIEYFNHSST